LQQVPRQSNPGQHSLAARQLPFIWVQQRPLVPHVGCTEVPQHGSPAAQVSPSCLQHFPPVHAPVQHGTAVVDDASHVAPRSVQVVHLPLRQTIWPQHSLSAAHDCPEALQQAPVLHSPEQQSALEEHALLGSRQAFVWQVP
jgi:hypothetical protein